MVKTRGLDRATNKWKDRVSVASGDYADGVANPREDWKNATLAAQDRYEAGVQASIRDKRFGAGVSASGTEKWAKKAKDLGARRWPEGVNAATPDYQAGMAKVITAIEGVALPPRYPAGDPRNYERVKAVGEAVRKAVRGK